MYLFIKNMSWYINIIILKTMQQTRTFFCVCPLFFFFFHVTWIPLQSCLPRQSVPSSSRRLCDTFHPQSSSFFPPSTPFPSFLSFACFLSCLSSSDSPPLSELFYVTSPTVCSFLRFPSCAPYSRSLSFSLHFSLSRPRVCTLTGTEKTFELTPVAAISVHLLAGDGVELQVTGPITFSVPLPPDSGLKENDHLPTWRFDPRLGMY